MRWIAESKLGSIVRGVGVAVLLQLFGCSCTAPKTTQARIPVERVVPPAPPKPTRAASTPFMWGLQVVRGGETHTYEPGRQGQQIPIGPSDWRCVHTGLTVGYNDRGAYTETRQIVCKVDTGQMIAGRTTCVRDVDGSVDDDIQILTVVDSDSEQHSIVTVCDKAEAFKSTPAPQTKEEDDGPTFQQPTTYDL